MDASRGTEHTDRREHPRADIHASAVVLVRHNDGVSSKIESLSMGGALMVGPLTLDPGERIQILFEIDGHPIEVIAEVIRVEVRELLHDHFAVRFIDLTSESRELIYRVVVRTLERTGGG